MKVVEAIKTFIDTTNEKEILLQDFLTFVGYIYFDSTGKELTEKEIRITMWKLIDEEVLVLTSDRKIKEGINYDASV